MAGRAHFINLMRVFGFKCSDKIRFDHWRPISSHTSGSKPTIAERSLKSQILKPELSTQTVTTLLQNWVNEGHKITVSHLRNISRQLEKSRRYKQVLEILTWRETQSGLKLSPIEHFNKMELTLKIHGLKEAEEYFPQLPNTSSQKAACLPLLRGYVKERAVEKAEAFMMKLCSLGLIVKPHAYNEMMKLYVGISQYEKVHSVIQEMKQNKVSLNVLSYNLWLDSCGESFDVASADMVFKEMVNDESVVVGWTTLATLANIYTKAGLVERATMALKNAERKLSASNCRGHLFLMTIYASLKNKDEVVRLWEVSKGVPGRITCANYMCILLCLVKVGDLGEAERVFMEWESSRLSLKYDIRVSNVLLGAYVRNGFMDKAESLHMRTLEKGGCPNYKTWEILMEGWVRNHEMDKAIDAMQKGFGLLKHGDWRPVPDIRPAADVLLAIVEYFEKHGNLEEGNSYIRLLHGFGLASLPLYRSLLRMHLSAQRPAFDILEMMEKDGIERDGETASLIQLS